MPPMRTEAIMQHPAPLGNESGAVAPAGGRAPQERPGCRRHGPVLTVLHRMFTLQ